MKKSILTASVLGAIGVVVSGAAFADINSASTYCKPGFYAGVQGGRTDTFYTQGDVLDQAATNEAYLAGAYPQTYTQSINNNGQITTYTSNNNGLDVAGYLTNQKVDDTGVGGRVFAGYQFNSYFAAELGYTQYGKTSFSATGVNTEVSADGFGNSETTTSTDSYSGDVTEHATDLVAKATLPLEYGFGVYAKAGAAYITADRYTNATLGTSITDTQVNNSSVSSAYTTTTTSVPSSLSGSTIYSKTYQAFRPTYGLGVDYTIPDTSVDVDVSWSRVQGMGNAIPNADLWALGVAYKFA